MFEQSSTFKLVQINGVEYLSNILEQCKMAGDTQFIVALSIQLTNDLLNQVSFILLRKESLDRMK